MEVFTVSRRPPSRPPKRCLVRSSLFSRSEQSALVRAYELALPVVRQTVAESPSATFAANARRRSPVSTLIGG
jgi:hypothetical protein